MMFINPPKKSMCEVKMSLIEGNLSIGIISGFITFAISRYEPMKTEIFNESQLSTRPFFKTTTKPVRIFHIQSISEPYF